MPLPNERVRFMGAAGGPLETERLGLGSQNARACSGQASILDFEERRQKSEAGRVTRPQIRNDRVTALVQLLSNHPFDDP